MFKNKFKKTYSKAPNLPSIFDLTLVKLLFFLNDVSFKINT